MTIGLLNDVKCSRNRHKKTLQVWGHKGLLQSQTNLHLMTKSFACSHHSGAASVDIVLQVTLTIVWRDNPRQTTVQGQVRRLVGHQKQ